MSNLDKKEAEHLQTFSYEDGVRDGELGILDSFKFSSTDVVIYLLKEAGYNDAWISNVLDTTDKNIKSTYAQMKEYRDVINGIKQKRAMKRLLKAIQKTK